ncbi:hypothetical protein LIER_01451 [Lithospermum erythrorhizon]|uniref:Retrotransposon gag domain-containing protein n=1 Tax=Lithospermum erythrorhizon TaxID=34254 RepID=A0AAV3NM54_LITER
MEIAATLKVNGVPADSIHRLLFSFSLSRKAKEWWNAQIPTNVTTWEQVVQKFLARFQGLLRKCPNHSFPRPYLVQTFHNGLTPSTHTILDVFAGGSFYNKTPDEAYILLEEFSANQHQPHPRGHTKRVAEVHKIDKKTKLEAQNGAFSNTYNNTWRNHPNLSWSNNQNVLRPSGFQDQTKFQKPEETRLDKLERLLTQMVEKDHNRDVALKNVERQLGQLAEALTNRNVDSLSSNTEKNPYEHTHAVTLRNGRNLEDEAEKQRQESRRNTNIQEQEDSIVKSHIPEDVPPPVPFPQRLHKKKIDIQFSKFLDMFKKLHINIPFAEALEQIPVGKITQLVLKN